MKIIITVTLFIVLPWNAGKKNFKLFIWNNKKNDIENQFLFYYLKRYLKICKFFAISAAFPSR